MLTRPHRQEALSRAYVQAIAACCGLNHSMRALDYGLDLSLHEVARRGKRHVESGTHLDLQVKSTTLASRGETHISYDLEVKAYEDLRIARVRVPRILVVVVLPADEARWLSLTEDELILRCSGYWLSLPGAPPVAATKTVRLPVPRVNQFSVEGLLRIFDQLGKGENL